MQKRLRLAGLTSGVVAAIIAVGGLASNLIANEIQEAVKPYQRWVWLVFAVAVLVAVLTAVLERLQRTHSSVVNPTESIDMAIDASAASDEARHRIVHVYHASSSTVNALHQLRAPLGDFVGREKEIDFLVAALRAGHYACISGLGGLGKTELSYVAAERLKDNYADAQLFIPLQGVDANPRAPEEVLATCIRAFVGSEVPLPEDLEELTRLYRSLLTNKRVLLVLDNAADGAQVRPLLPPSGSSLLVTSRQAIALPGFTSLTLNPFSDKEARELLIEIVPRAEPVAQEIVALCGYLPLAIRAAGSLLAITPDLKPADYAAQLEDKRTRLERIGTEGVEIGVASSFNVSYERLTSESARVFRLLSIFPGSFDGSAEQEICGDPNHALLSYLVARRSLVLYDARTDRYRLHDLARLFAKTKLDKSEEQWAHRRHAEYFLAQAETVERRLEDNDRKHMDWFKAVQDDMRLGLEWSLQNNADMALRFAYSLSGFWNMLGQLTEERTALNRALARSDEARPELRMRVLGRAAARQSNPATAKTLAQAHLNLSRQTRQQIEEAWALQNLGNTARLEGRLTDARELQTEALKLFRLFEDKTGTAMTLLNLCAVAVDQDDFAAAQEFVTESLKLSEEVDSRGDIAIARSYLAFLLQKAGKEAAAKELIEASIVMLREDARQSWLPWGLHWKGRIATDRGDFEAAFDALSESIALFQQNEDIGGQIRTLLAFAWLNARQGFWERAATLLAAEESQRNKEHSPAAPDWRREIEFIKTNLQAQLDGFRFTKACEVGEQMTLDQAVSYALKK